jgi:hypothetical protein
MVSYNISNTIETTALYPSVFPPIHNSPYRSHENTEPYMSVCLSCHIRDRSFCHNAHWQTNYKHEMHTCIQQNMQNGGWKQWRGTTHIFIFECGLDVKVPYSRVQLTNVNLWRPKHYRFTSARIPFTTIFLCQTTCLLRRTRVWLVNNELKLT